MTDDLAVPDLSAVGPALIRAEALAALGAEGCVYPDLAALALVQSLAFDAESVAVFVADERGNRRHGVSVGMLASQMRADFDAKAPGKLFRKR